MFYFSQKGFIVPHVAYFKIADIAFLFILNPTNTIVALFVIGYPVGIGCGVHKFNS